MDAQGTDSPEAPRRARGRPRKLPDARDEGNRRRELLRGAARLFRSRGFAAVSTRDIAAAAGMQSGSPFYHFESKSALLHAVMHEGWSMPYAASRRHSMACAPMRCRKSAWLPWCATILKSCSAPRATSSP